MEIEILYDGQREMREAFTVHMKPDDNMVAEIQVTQRATQTNTNQWQVVYMRTRTVPRIHTRKSMRPVMSACVKIARQQLAMLSARLEPQSLIKSFSLWNEMLMGNVPAEPNSRHTYKQNWDILPIY